MAPFIISLAYNSEHVYVKHEQAGKLSFSNRFIVRYTCRRAKTLRAGANFFENGEKSCVFKRIRIRVDRALAYLLFHVLFAVAVTVVVVK